VDGGVDGVRGLVGVEAARPRRHDVQRRGAWSSHGPGGLVEVVVEQEVPSGEANNLSWRRASPASWTVKPLVGAGARSAAIGSAALGEREGRAAIGRSGRGQAGTRSACSSSSDRVGRSAAGFHAAWAVGGTGARLLALVAELGSVRSGGVIISRSAARRPGRRSVRTMWSVGAEDGGDAGSLGCWTASPYASTVDVVEMPGRSGRRARNDEHVPRSAFTPAMTNAIRACHLVEDGMHRVEPEWSTSSATAASRQNHLSGGDAVSMIADLGGELGVRVVQRARSQTQDPGPPGPPGRAGGPGPSTASAAGRTGGAG
jgi:hypothetical protein